MFLVAAGALHFGTRETHLTARAAICWREGYDCVEMCRHEKDWDKIPLEHVVVTHWTHATSSEL